MDHHGYTARLSRKIRDKYINEKHLGSLVITGDPAGMARSTQTEDGTNNFTIIMNNMRGTSLRPEIKVLPKQPAQVQRLDFINALFDGYDGWQVMIDMRCRKLTEDLINQKKNPDGTKNKTKITDPKTRLKYEKYGHLSDCMDYIICMFLSDSWKKFQTKRTTVVTVDPNTAVYNGFSF